MKCSDIYDVYSNFFYDLKRFKGNSNGFTGLSEYVIFRFLYHQLGGSFASKGVTTDLYEFVSGDVRIGQSLPVIIDRKRYYPDVIIYRSGKLVAIIQIKLYFTSGAQEISRELRILQKFRDAYPELKALLISFSGLPKRSKLLVLLEEERDTKAWFNFLILQGNNERLSQKLQDYLGL